VVKHIDPRKSQTPEQRVRLTYESDGGFEPGGWLNPPDRSIVPLLNLQAYPRMNIYVEDEEQASLIVGAQIGYEVGVPFCQPAKELADEVPRTEATFSLGISIFAWQETIEISTTIPFNSTGNEIPLAIEKLSPRFEPYELQVTLSTAQCAQTFSISTQIYRLPKREDGGSVTKLDYLYGGLHVQQNESWKPVFPFGFYVDWGGYLMHLDNQHEYAALDYNVVNPVPGGGDTPFEPDLFDAYVGKSDLTDQHLMYNMRWTYKNATLVTSQINKLKPHKSILLWYTADEPGGQSDPFDAPLQAYDLIRKLDPYHPVSLVLNCANFHYDKYTRGADIIMTDPYPIAVNTSWSSRWHTECNTTYGCCGCDNCHGSFRDISTRLDNFKKFQHWLSNAPLGKPSSDPGRSPGGPKSFWGVPQVFGGSEYWRRPPTAEEEVVMVWLFINHGAKGIVGWLFPTTAELTSVMSAVAKIVTSDEVTGLLLGDNPRSLDVEANEAVDVDAAAWIVGSKMMISIVYLGLEDTEFPVVVKLPSNVKSETARQLWPIVDGPLLHSQDGAIGEAGLKVQDQSWPWPEERPHPSWLINGSEAKRVGLPALSVSIIVIDTE
jgi:hypothetical protein